MQRWVWRVAGRDCAGIGTGWLPAARDSRRPRPGSTATSRARWSAGRAGPGRRAAMARAAPTSGRRSPGATPRSAGLAVTLSTATATCLAPATAARAGAAQTAQTSWFTQAASTSASKYCIFLLFRRHGYAASEEDTCHCEEGWQGPLCDHPVCSPGCHSVHGSCSRPNQCICNLGWQGVSCDQCVKYPACGKWVSLEIWVKPTADVFVARFTLLPLCPPRTLLSLASCIMNYTRL